MLWCYKKDLGFSSHKKKRMKQVFFLSFSKNFKKKKKKKKKKKVKKLKQKGIYNENVDEPFELFINSSEIRYCYYKETQKILGNTFDVLILSDFESITPNILCRTIETVQGGCPFAFHSSNKGS